MTSAVPRQGLQHLSVVVLSVQNNLALVRDQTGRQIQVRRDILPAKGAWPEPGEQWIIEKRFGNEWTFALVLGSTRPGITEVAGKTERDAITGPTTGQLVFRRDVRSLDVWDGTVWRGTAPAPTETLTSLSASRQTEPTVHGYLNITDPGWPYKLEFFGAMRVAVDIDIGFFMGMRLGTGTSGELISKATIVRPNSNANNNSRTYPIFGRTLGEMIGQQWVALVLQKTEGPTTGGWQVHNSIYSMVYARVVPA